MIKRVQGFIVGAVVASAAALGAQNAERHDGGWWSLMTSEWKLGYALGYMEGKQSTARTAAALIGVQTIGSVDVNALRKLEQQFLTEVRQQDGIWNTQLVAGLAEFYRDYRNRSINLVDAIDIVQRQIKGSLTAAEAQTYTEWVRRQNGR